MKFIKRFIKYLFGSSEKALPQKNDRVLRQLSAYKPAWEMNRNEKREYKRFLAKHRLWDGYFIEENQRRMGILDTNND